jgi:hypothetical protein
VIFFIFLNVLRFLSASFQKMILSSQGCTWFRERTVYLKIYMVSIVVLELACTTEKCLL